jgi:ATP-dependent Lon protease
MKDNKQVLLITQKDSTQDNPNFEDLYDIGTVGSVLQLLKLPDGTVKVLVEGIKRAKVIKYIDNEKFFEASAEIIPDEKSSDNSQTEALSREVVKQFEEYVRLSQKIPPEALGSVRQIEEKEKLADTIASHLSLKISQKQEILEMGSIKEKLEKILGFMESEMNVLQVEKKIRGRVKGQMDKTQREYYLNEQIKAIQKELGEIDDGHDELSELEQKIKKTKLSKEARTKCEGEFKKLRSMSPMSAEATVVRNYLDWMLSLPWKAPTTSNKDIKKAEKILNDDHYGLTKVKERILEYLAVQIRMRKLKGPILCLVGPPGVGKTSLGQSIATATGRNFVRMSLGGIRDEAEIRGHRRTYIGSLPGKIVQGMKKAKSSNPLFLLDEVDKVGVDWRGDPTSALLEVLDPEQNAGFNDNYLEVDYDLSDVMFITTANTLRMPAPLLDRMEVIRIAGYTEDEKVSIAFRHLIPKQMKDHGLKKGECNIIRSAVVGLIRYYTREAGVRNLEREIANLTRKSVKNLLTSRKKKITISAKNLDKFAGVRRYTFGEAEEDNLVGVSTGLAWTEAGGELLSVEAVTMPGKGKISHTGQLGDVMKESAQAAQSYVRSRSFAFGIPPPIFEKKDIHVHVPEGATPKDGPSAGVAMCCSIVSTLTGIATHKDIAMTGEITLRGRVLQIGGLKEKLLAAVRGGMKRVIIPQENEKDLAEISNKIKKSVKILPVKTVDEVLQHALTKPLSPIEWSEKDELEVSKSGKRDQESKVTAH